MSILVNTRYRTDKVELMDDFSIAGPDLHDTLDKLTGINKWLGGRGPTIGGLKYLLKDHAVDQPVTCVDLGCGDGDMLRKVADFGQRYGYTFNLIGVDANENTVNYGKQLSREYANIRFSCCDIFSDEFDALEYDMVLATLFLHHFSEEQVMKLLEKVLTKASLGVVVNDLHRHPLAYYLFNLLCLTISNPMVKDDGLTSILRGFKRDELERISRSLKANYQIRWKWAFRYQWIMKRIK